jgi:hypothetical protein
MNITSKSKNGTAKRGDHNHSTFGERVISFFHSLQIPKNLPSNIEGVYPYARADVMHTVEDFYHTFFNDNNQRVIVLGINPGRFGSGMTGVPFTDPVELETRCGIDNTFIKRREISSEFVYKFIEEYGGPNKFYSDFFLSAISPIGFVHNGRNYNYYDNPKLYETLQPYIVDTLKKQISFGIKKTVILFGTSKNKKIFTEINNTYNFFDTVLALEHPRYIMQYERRHVDVYIKKYMDVFSQALKNATR